MINKKHFILIGFLLIGCTPLTEQEQEYYRQREAQKEAKNFLLGAKHYQTKLDQAVEMVKGHLVSGDLRTDDWVNQHVLYREDGSIPFQRWRAERRGENRYHVKFLYSVVNEEDAEVEKKGYLWTLDMLTGVISEARELKGEEIQKRRYQSSYLQQQKRRLSLQEEAASK